MNILAVDIGGTHVKVLLSGHDPTERRRFPSGHDMTPDAMMEGIRGLLDGWSCDAVSIGYPGPVRDNKPAVDPWNLGPGWKDYDFEAAFGVPTRVVNDAAMQALGSYQGGRMLFLGFGTGLGSALIVEGHLQPLELGHLPYRKERTYEDYAGQAGYDRMGKKKWRKHARSIIEILQTGLQADYVVLGGGNAKHLGELPEHWIMGGNQNAFTGGFRLWQEAREVRGERQEDSPAAPGNGPDFSI